MGNELYLVDMPHLDSEPLKLLIEHVATKICARALLGSSPD
jgi:hypothetical protein